MQSEKSEQEENIWLGDASTTSEQVNSDAFAVSVSDPVKEDDDYVTYQVSARTLLSGYAQNAMQVRRRFSDFAWLYDRLKEEHPFCVVPPLPEKHRLEYLTGHRFSSEFLEKRCLELERFLRHITTHPILQKSRYLRIFLESQDMKRDMAICAAENKTSVVEELSYAIMNTISRFQHVKDPSDRFKGVNDELDRIETKLKAVEKSQLMLHQMEKEVQKDCIELSSCLELFSAVEQDELSGTLQALSSVLQEASKQMASKVRTLS